MRALYRIMGREFPDFDQSTLPVIPVQWSDISWHNDVCPSFAATRSDQLPMGIIVWIDYAKPEDRQFPDACRFGAYLTNAKEERVMSVEGDDWGAILRGVDAMQAEHSAWLEIAEAKTVTDTFDGLVKEFRDWTVPQGLIEGDAMDLLYRDDLTTEQRKWLSNFVNRWDAMEDAARNMRDLDAFGANNGVLPETIEAARAERARIWEGF